MRAMLLNKIAKKEKELDCLYLELKDYIDSLTIPNKEAKEYGYKIHELDELKTLFEKSCPLKFIYNWSLTEYYVGQCEDAVIK